jgi:hypothetical protein
MGIGVLLIAALAIDPQLARIYLSEARVASESGPRLWPADLYGPIVFVDPKNRDYVTADSEGAFPKSLGLANTAIDWNGGKWSMILWPLPEDRNQRIALILHESFHRVQATLGLPMTDPPNSHLDTLEGRYWMQLEWRALSAALQSEGEARRKAAADAVRFRRQRRALFPESAETERALEMNEGLAEYTGVARSGAALRLALKDLEDGAKKATFVRSFAYASGPAYGLLLDASGADWRKNLKPSDDLGDWLVRAMKLDVPGEPVTDSYNSAALRRSEIQRQETHDRQIAEYRKLLVDGPILEIPLKSMSMDFDPNKSVPLEGLGTVYPTIRVRDVWGSIDSSQGALMAANFRKLTVPLAARDIGWKLELKPGWKMAPGKRPGDFTIVPEN